MSFYISEHDNACVTVESLHQVVQNLTGPSKKNPKTVAKELKDIGCPFSCNYKSYKVDPVYKTRDISLKDDTLKLSFKILNQDKLEVDTVDVYYSFDMFLSDVGNAFGILLGMSLIELISLFSQTMVDFKNKASLSISYIFVKWTLTIGFISFAVLSAVFNTFPGLNDAIDQKSNSGERLFKAMDEVLLLQKGK